MNDEQKKYLWHNKWVVKRGDQTFIKFAGLLWLAHQMGMESLESYPVREDYENNMFVFEATAKGRKIIGGAVRKVKFSDQGDADPDNTGKMIIPHIRRMASTRAMARVLRIYCGVGMTSYEECNFSKVGDGG